MTPLKVLVLCANPIHSKPLEIEDEVRKIRQKIRASEHRDRVAFAVYSAVHPRELQNIVRNERPHIVHFSGHGTADEILFENDDHTARPVTKEALAELFEIAQLALDGQIRAVVLNACYSAANAEAIMEHVGCVVGMNHAIEDAAAIEFSASFYEAMANSSPPELAFRWGKSQVRLLWPDLADIPQIKVRPDKQPPLRVLIHADLADDNRITDDDLRKRLPEKPDHTFNLRSFGVSASLDGSDLNWPACARAIRDVHATARSLVEAGRAIHYYVAGRAALPVFAFLGIQLSTWASVTLLNRRGDHRTWDILPLDGVAPRSHDPFFRSVEGLEQPSDAEGRVALFVSTGRPLVTSTIASFIQEQQGDRLAGVVALQAGGAGGAMLDESNGPAAMAQLDDAFKRLTVAYPRRTGLALFVAGPATLAFMAGRALNPRVIRDIWLPNYNGQAYEPALTFGGPGHAVLRPSAP